MVNMKLEVTCDPENRSLCLRTAHGNIRYIKENEKTRKDHMQFVLKVFNLVYQT